MCFNLLWLHVELHIEQRIALQPTRGGGVAGEEHVAAVQLDLGRLNIHQFVFLNSGFLDVFHVMY